MARRDDINSGYTVEPVMWPDESFGDCKNIRKCKSYDVWLAWGWCQECYDRKLRHLYKDEVGSPLNWGGGKKK